MTGISRHIQRGRILAPILVLAAVAAGGFALCAAPALASGWESQYSGAGSDTWLTSISVTGPADVWTLGAPPNTLLHTTDGASWYGVGLPSLSAGNDVECATFVDPDHGWVGCRLDPHVAYTTDGGADWTTTTYTGPMPAAIAFANDDVGWIGTFNSDTVMKTTDGGADWDPQTVGTSTGGARGLAAVSPLVCWASTSMSVSLTTDGGSDWTQVMTPLSSGYLAAIAATDDQHAWAVGGQGLIVATTDGGGSWQTQHALGSTPADLEAIDFTDDQYGWAVGDGIVLATTDSGTTWLPQVPGVDAILLGVGFASRTEGWAVGTEGTIIHTTDGGGVPDTSAPMTTPSPTDGTWVNAASARVTLTATDGGGIGLWRIEYTVDGLPGAWSNVSPAVVPLTVDAATHADDGPHQVQFQAIDKGGNLEALQSTHINVDTRLPHAKAPSKASVRRNKYVKLKFEILDAAPNGGFGDAQIVISNRSGKMVKILYRYHQPVNVIRSCRFRCRLAKGAYSFHVDVRDLAYNYSVKTARNTLVVK